MKKSPGSGRGFLFVAKGVRLKPDLQTPIQGLCPNHP